MLLDITCNLCGLRVPIAALALVGHLGELFQPVFELAGPFEQPFLVAREPPHGILRGSAWFEPAELRCHLPLPVGKLSGFELQLAKGAPPIVWPRQLQTLLEVAQFVERATCARARLNWSPAAQVSRRLTHVLGDIPHPRVLADGGLSVLRWPGHLLR